MRIATTLLAGCLLLAACGGGGERLDPAPISKELQDELETWLAAQGRAPDEYVLGLFEERDVVLIGEFHRIRHDLELVRSLLPRLQDAGVRVFATEFARREDQPLIDSLLAAPEWDEMLGRRIVFNMFMPWGFREYVDLFKEAWRLNAEGAALRVVGVNNSMDYSQFKSEADWNDPEAHRRATGGQTEADWAGAVLAEVRAGEKVLVHCGIHHAFAGYRQPRVAAGEFAGFGVLRLGNHLREALGERAATVYLHAPWNTAAGYDVRFVHPAGGRLDAFMLAREGGPFAVGFDTADSPLAGLPIEDAVYKHGHEPFGIEQFADGWIYTRSLAEYEPVAYIEDWIHEGNAAEARAAAMNPRWRDWDVEQLSAGCRSYRDDFERFFGGLR